MAVWRDQAWPRGAERRHGARRAARSAQHALEFLRLGGDQGATLDLAQAGITSVLWATGYAVDYSWLKLDVFDERGWPKHQRGVSHEPGLYFLGLPWLSRRASSFIYGVWHDAKYLADHMATQRRYLEYRPSSPGS